MDHRFPQQSFRTRSGKKKQEEQRVQQGEEGTSCKDVGVIRLNPDR